MEPRPAAGVHLALVLVQVLFGIWPVAARVILRTVPGPALVGLRCAGACLLLFALLRGRQLPRALHGRTAVAALLGITINQLLFLEGVRRTGAVNAAVMITTIPVFTLLLGLLLRTESLGIRRILGMALALGGALTVTGMERIQLGPDVALGNLLLLCSAAAYASYLVMTGRLSRHADARTLVPWVFLYGLLTSLPFSVPSAMDSLPWTVTPTLVALLVFMVVGPTVGTYLLNAYALRSVPPSLVAIYIYLQPLVAALLAWPVLGESPSAALMLGAVPIFLGVLLATRP